MLKFLKDSTRPVGLVSIVSEQAALSVGTAVCRSDRGANDHGAGQAKEALSRGGVG